VRSFQNHPGYWAFLGHRLSGIVLALFLPVHFLVLALALKEAGPAEGSFAFAALPVVKFAELGLVVLLTIHLVFGSRLLMLELFPKRHGDDLRLGWIAVGMVAAVVVAGVFLAGVR
jgi:fumarate reductase subunit D